jgi:4-carboxymuconolactone decarboxylase
MEVRTMAVRKKAENERAGIFSGQNSDLLGTDPEFVKLFGDFAFGEVVNGGVLDDRIRLMAVMASLIGCQGVDEFREMVQAALRSGLTPIELREIVYQAVPYCGLGRVRPFIIAMDQELEGVGVELPLPSQTTTTAEDRLAKGIQAQVDIFGEGMREFTRSGPEETRHINTWLADNCFGDYYTRKGLDLRQREMITFCFLAAQGGCEPQLVAHAGANMKVGNDRIFLIQIVSQCLPYIGYPRSLNAIRCIAEASKNNG